MTLKQFRVFFVLLMAVFTSSCALRQANHQSPDISEHWVIVPSDKPGEKYVVIKSARDLEATLAHMGCKQHPCSVGRLGDLYVISDAAQKLSKN